MACNSIFINKSTHEKSCVHISGLAYEIGSLLKHCVFTPAAWVSRLNVDCEFTQL